MPGEIGQVRHLRPEVELGKRIYQRSFVLKAQRSPSEWLEFLQTLPLAIGMTPVGAPAVWNYPIDGKGGVGQTLFQPITESFIALDTWDDHMGAYLFVVSCRPFERTTVIEHCARRAIIVDHDKYLELAL